MLSCSASPRGRRNLVPVIRKNIQIDYGANGDGNSDFTAFSNFRTFAIAQTDWVELTIPPTGSFYNVFGSYIPFSSGNFPFAGIKKLIVLGYGATIGPMLGGVAFFDDANHRFAIETVSSGASTVTLRNAAHADQLTVGDLVMVAGFTLQREGYPINQHFFEYRFIGAKDGANITFTEPLENAYRSDWPFYSTAAAMANGAGPGAIYPTRPEFNVEQFIYGLHFNQTPDQVYFTMRHAKLIDCTADGGGIIPTASITHEVIDQDHGIGIEVDKLVTRAVITGQGPSGVNINVQSSSIRDLVVRGGSRSINGTARRTHISGGSSSSIRLGPTAFGISEEIRIENREVASFLAAPGLGNAVSEFTFTDGVLRREDYADPLQWAVPGAQAVIRTVSPFLDHHVFNILGVTMEGTDPNGPVLIETDMPGSTLPEVSGLANGSFLRHNAPNLTVINCTGSDEAVELSQAPANSPYGSFRKRTYDGTLFQINGAPALHVLGRLVHLKINVIQAYTGPQADLTVKLAQNGMHFVLADKTRIQSHLRVNLRIAGERIITPAGVTGAQSGDVALSDATAGVWVPGTHFGCFIGKGTNGSTAHDISGESSVARPIFTIEVLTDQEFS